MGNRIIIGYFLCLFIYLCNGLLQDNFSKTIAIDDCTKQLLEFQVVPHEKEITLVNATDSLAKTIHSMRKASINSRKYLAINNTYYNRMYVLVSEDFKELAEGFKLIKKDPYWNPKAKFIILLQDFSDMHNVSKLVLDHKMYNVTVIAKDLNEDFVIHAFMPFYDSCNRPAIKNLQPICRCSELEKNTEVFNLMNSSSIRGCRQRLVTHNFYPFVQMSNTNVGERIGLEQYIINIVQEFEGVIVDLISYKNNETFGNVYPNYSHTGMLKEIESKSVDGAVGGYTITANRANSLWFLYPYMNDRHSIYVRRARLLDTWEAVLAHFTIFQVSLILTTFAIFSFVVIQLSIFKRYREDMIRDVLVVYGYLLSNVTSKLMKSYISHRIIVITVLIFSMILSAIIQGCLMSAKTRPLRDFQVDSVEEIIRTHQFIVSPSTLDFMFSNSVLDMSRAQTKCNLTMECIKMVKESKDKLYTTASNMYYDYSVIDDKDDSGVYKTGDAMGIEWQTMFFSRGSTVLNAFNKVIGRARDSGLLLHHFSKMDFERRLKYFYHHEKKSSSKQFCELKQAFILLILGYVLSFLTFIYECKSKK